MPSDSEWCDGRDNDCDAIVDEGRVCPDSAIANTLPAGGSVHAYVSSSSELLALWPESAARVAGFDARPGLIRMRADGTLYDARWLIRRVRDGGPDLEIPTPPCFTSRYGWFDFDAAGRLIYECDGGFLRFGEGQLLRADTGIGSNRTYPIRATADGSVLVYSHELRELRWVLPEGGDVVVDIAFSDFDGTMELLPTPHAVSVDDSVFLVAYRRYRGGTRSELVAFRADRGSPMLRLVRRVPVAHGDYQGSLALADGSVILHRRLGGDSRNLLAPVDGPATSLAVEGWPVHAPEL